MRHNLGKIKQAKAESVLTKEAFRIGFLASNRKLFAPEIFFTDQQNLWDYERGFHFATILRTKGIVLRTLPKKPTAQLKDLIREAVWKGDII